MCVMSKKTWEGILLGYTRTTKIFRSFDKFATPHPAKQEKHKPHIKLEVYRCVFQVRIHSNDSNQLSPFYLQITGARLLRAAWAKTAAPTRASELR